MLDENSNYRFPPLSDREAVPVPVPLHLFSRSARSPEMMGRNEAPLLQCCCMTLPLKPLQANYSLSLLNQLSDTNEDPVAYACIH